MNRASAFAQATGKSKASTIREKMAGGGVVIGGHTFFLDPAITESLGYHGFEFVWIDGEHSAFDQACILQHIKAASGRLIFLSELFFEAQKCRWRKQGRILIKTAPNKEMVVNSVCYTG